MSSSPIQKKALVISFIYPPLGGSGVQRTLKFTKYLPELGWQPYVVCSDDPRVFDDGLDPSLMAEIPTKVQVWRRTFVNPMGLRRWVQRRLGIRMAEYSNKAENHPNTEVNHAGLYSAPGPGWKRSLRRFFKVLSTPLAVFEFPPVDAALYWALAIVPGCLRLLHREKIDIIYSTSFPYSDHVTGYLLKRLTGKPWVADFRDPWTQNASARNTGWRFRTDRWVEQRVLHLADRVIGVTPSYTADLRSLAPRRSADDFLTLENGYDHADFTEQNSLAHTPGNPIVLAHVGYLYDGTALPFFRALETLGEAAARLQVRFVGGLAPQEQRWLDCHPQTVQFQVEPRQPHAEAVQTMREADLLLLFVISGSPRSGHYPGKLFEYIASGRPILLVGPEGDAARLVESSGTGCFVTGNDQIGLAQILKRLIEEPEAFCRQFFHPDPQVIATYERRSLTSKLANIFGELSGSIEKLTSLLSCPTITGLMPYR